MATYVYRVASSSGARELAEALDGLRARNTQRLQQRLRAGDYVVCWGERLAPVTGVRILNGGPLANKYEDAMKLRQERVPTIEVSRSPGFATRPPQADPAVPLWAEVAEMAGDLVELQFDRANTALREGVTQLQASLGRLNTALGTPLPPPVQAVEWLPRISHHVGGKDLLDPPDTPDYYAKKENFVREYRIHSFEGKSIRAGIKAPRAGFANPHPWIRSWDAGWAIRYDGVSSKQRHREIAHRAVAALGLDFGAVDIGEKADNSLVVLEVNRAPGLEGGTIGVYATAIQQWMQQGVRQRQAA